MLTRSDFLEPPEKPHVLANDIIALLDSSSGRIVRVSAKTLKEYTIKELLERVATVAGSNEQILSRIRLVEETQATEGVAVAKSVKFLESQMSGGYASPLKSSISTIERTYATQGYAEAKKTEALVAAGADAQARVDVAYSALATRDGYLEGKVTLKATAGHVVTGLNITSATGDGEDISDITFDVGNLKVTDGVTTGYPFQVVGGAVRVRNLTLVPADIAGLGSLATQNSVGYASITGSKPPTDADSTSDALIGGVNINSGGVTLSGTAAIKSSNYSAGSVGWSIKADGSVEFNNGTFRGAIEATSGTIGDFYIGPNAMFCGDMYLGNPASTVVSGVVGTTLGRLQISYAGNSLVDITGGISGGTVAVYNNAGSPTAYLQGSTGVITCAGIDIP